MKTAEDIVRALARADLTAPLPSLVREAQDWCERNPPTTTATGAWSLWRAGDVTSIHHKTQEPR